LRNWTSFSSPWARAWDGHEVVDLAVGRLALHHADENPDEVLAALGPEESAESLSRPSARAAGRNEVKSLDGGERELRCLLLVTAAGGRCRVRLRAVVVLRCTQRLLFRLKRFDDDPDAKSTTRLGDWYGNLLRVGHRHALLFIAERSRLPVLLPVRAADRLATALPAGVADTLTAIGIPAKAIEQELAQMSPLRFGMTHSRSLLGSLTEFTRLAWFDFMTRRDVPLDVIARELAEVPLMLPFKGEAASAVTRRLFSVK